MLRNALLILGVVLLIAGVYQWVMRETCGYPLLLIWGTVLTVGVLFERWRYRKLEGSEAAHWQNTGERFEDPETGKTVEVYYDPATGERKYVHTDNGGPHKG